MSTPSNRAKQSHADSVGLVCPGATPAEESARPEQMRAKRLRIMWREEHRFSAAQFGRYVGVGESTARRLLLRDSGPPSTKLRLLPLTLRKEVLP